MWQRILYSFRQIPNGLLLPPSLTAPRCNLCSNTVSSSSSSSACHLYYIYGPEPSLFYPNCALPTLPLTLVPHRTLSLRTFPPRNTGFKKTSHFVFNAGGSGGCGTRPYHFRRCRSVLFSFRRWWLVHKNLLPTVCSSILSRPNTLCARSNVCGFTQKNGFRHVFYLSFVWREFSLLFPNDPYHITHVQTKISKNKQQTSPQATAADNHRSTCFVKIP